MALDEQPREDLLRDATAYGTRMQWSLDDAGNALFCGVRSDGSWSLYFGEDPVLQFNRQGELRRLYLGGQKFAAQGRLARIERAHRGGRVELDFREVNEQEQAQMLLVCTEKLVVARQIADDSMRWIGSVPDLSYSSANSILNGLIDQTLPEIRVAVRPSI